MERPLGAIYFWARRLLRLMLIVIHHEMLDLDPQNSNGGTSSPRCIRISTFMPPTCNLLATRFRPTDSLVFAANRCFRRRETIRFKTHQHNITSPSHCKSSQFMLRRYISDSGFRSPLPYFSASGTAFPKPDSHVPPARNRWRIFGLIPKSRPHLFHAKHVLCYQNYHCSPRRPRRY